METRIKSNGIQHSREAHLRSRMCSWPFRYPSCAAHRSFATVRALAANLRRFATRLLSAGFGEVKRIPLGSADRALDTESWLDELTASRGLASFLVDGTAENLSLATAKLFTASTLLAAAGNISSCCASSEIIIEMKSRCGESS